MFRSLPPILKKEMEENGYGEFLLRAWVVPYTDPKMAQVTLVAMPLLDVSDAVDRHHVTGGGGYPCLLVDDSTFASVGPRVTIPGGSFGCPNVPVIVDSGDEIHELDTGEMVEMTRTLWSRMTLPYLVTTTKWEELTATSPVQLNRQKADHCWPALVVAPGDQGGKSGVFFNYEGFDSYTSWHGLV